MSNRDDYNGQEENSSIINLKEKSKNYGGNYLLYTIDNANKLALLPIIVCFTFLFVCERIKL